ncbi:MAG: ATP-grasp domain-containing protein [Chloroflexi bacterium]|nr:ATP-grasp domain-containing protein [Chloroflexota bacterium]
MPGLRGKKRLFRKVLIANRGEIACRVIRTCEHLGIKTIAVYSEADANALHVKRADEAVLLGPALASESYLNIAAIIRAALDQGAEAVHPGYGFLAQSAGFATACAKAGLAFIGPTPEVMQQMADKAMARRLAAEAGLPLLPGTETDITDEEAVARAQEIGFPLMVKAAHGGGGIGIREVRTPEELPEALERARSLAQNAFGSPRLYLEKHLEGPSHVEVQVLADQHGRAIHLFERDCSIQRRNQKVVEETPCVKLDPALRQEMYAAALAFVRHISYTNAGTVEFLLDQEGRFYFLEMNTRIQVEHPVTEMVTEHDLVEQQIRIAAGERLALSQEDVHSHGYAIEARVYPEDPTTLLPVAGTMTTVKEPKGRHLRVDSALFSGYEVSPFYDALMAKVVAWGRSRSKAISRLQNALGDFGLEGVPHNIPMLQQVLASPEFVEGTYNTLTLGRILGRQESAKREEEERHKVAAVMTALGHLFAGADRARPSPWKTYGRAAQMSPGPGRGNRW